MKRFILLSALPLFYLGVFEGNAQCTVPAGNKVINPSFESRPGTGWRYSGSGSGGFSYSSDYEMCGSNYGLLYTSSSGKKIVYQDVDIEPGTKVTFSVWAGIHSRANQKIRLVFLNNSGNEMSSGETSVDVTYTVTSNRRLREYELSATAPTGANKIRIEGSVQRPSRTDGTFYLKLEMAVLLYETTLPVVLSDIGVGAEGNSARLSWATAEEANSREFEVLHSRDGKDWSVLGAVEAKGNFTGDSKYSFVHGTPGSGVNLYRLRMIDLDGSSELSRAVSIRFAERTGEKPYLYPNPSKGVVSVSFGAGTSGLKIFDGLGREVFSASKENVKDTLDMSHLPEGSYIVRFEGAGGYASVQRIRIGR